MTRNDLEQIYYLDREVKMWENELKRLRQQSLVQSPVSDGIHNTGISDKVGDLATRIVTLEELIESKSLELQTAHRSAVEYIFAIPDSLIRQIVYCRCVKLMSWQRVAFEVGGGNTEGSVRKAYSRFFDKNNNLPKCCK